MNIGSVGSSAVSPFLALKVRFFAKDRQAETLPSSTDCAANGTCAEPPAQTPSALTVPSAQSSNGLADFSGQTFQESILALQIRLRTQLSTSNDGTVSERTSVKLRFHYDLTTADGQHIELNVKAKVQQASNQDAAGNSISKTQVKLQFSLLQEGVADGLSPLQSDQVPSDARSGVTGGLQAFLNSVGDALQQFDDGNVTADDLVKKTVDTFNNLVDALTNLLFFPASEPVVTSLPAAPLPAAEGVTNEPPQPGSPPEVSGVNAVAGDPAISADPIPLDQVAPAVQPAPPEGSLVPLADSNAATSPAQFATQVLRDVRLRFVQSLTQIIQTLTPEEQPENSSPDSSQRLYYRSSFSLRIHTASLLDVNA